MRPRYPISLAIVLLLFTAACANTAFEPPTPTFDLSGLPTITPAVNTSVPPTQSPPTESVLAAPTIASPQNPSGLKIVFSQNGNLWFWSETTSARQLTSDGEAGSPKLSDDGNVVAFQRGQTLWAVNTDGTNLRQLADITASTSHPFLAQFEFQPNTHILYFSSRDSVQSTVGLDLHRVNADSPAPQTILQQGGQFTFSPNGALLAIVQIDRIHIIRLDTAAPISVLEFKQINTNSDWFYYPQVVWLNDSTGFYTVIPGANLGEKSRFLYVSADGSFTAQLAEFVTADLRLGQPIIAPNGSKVAYVTQADSTLEVHVIDASTADLSVASHPNAPLIGLLAWSPDSARFAYHAGDPSRLLLTGVNISSMPLLDSFTSHTFTWVDANRFLYFANGELRLGQIDTPLLTVVATGFPDWQGYLGSYDFTP